MLNLSWPVEYRFVAGPPSGFPVPLHPPPFCLVPFMTSDVPSRESGPG